MSLDTIIVDYDPFAMESRVSICQERKREQTNVFSSIEELANGIIELAYKHNVYDVKMNGPFAIASEVNKMIKQLEKNQYSESKINVGNL